MYMHHKYNAKCAWLNDMKRRKKRSGPIKQTIQVPKQPANNGLNTKS